MSKYYEEIPTTGNIEFIDESYIPECSADSFFQNYRKRFVEITGGWRYINPYDLMDHLIEELDELKHEVRNYSTTKGSSRIAVELADVVILAMDILEGDGRDFTSIIKNRMESNFDRASRAKAAADIKGTKISAEWETTPRREVDE